MSGRVTGLPESLEPRRRGASPRQRWSVVAIIVVVSLGAITAWFIATKRGAPSVAGGVATVSGTSVESDSLAHAPAGVRIRVRVVNATDQRGLARRATLFLRDMGYDVVDFDGDRKERRDHSAIVAHAAHDDWGTRLQRAMATTVLERSTDTSRYVDFTVLVGRDWQPPAQPLRP
jgi:hypothetical protein